MFKPERALEGKKDRICRVEKSKREEDKALTP